MAKTKDKLQQDGASRDANKTLQKIDFDAEYPLESLNLTPEQLEELRVVSASVQDEY